MSNSEEPEDQVSPTTSPEAGPPQGESGEASDPNGPVNTDYQDSDIHLETVKKFVAGSFAITIAFFVLMLMVHRFYKKGFSDDRGVATAAERQIPGKDDALLQTQPLMDLAEYQALEEQRLTTQTNAGEHAVIPVESAKRLMVEEGFPHSQGMEEEPSVAEPAVHDFTEPVEPVADTQSAVELAAAPAAPEAPPVDPAMAAAGKKIWEQQCMAACHTGKRGAIAPNIEKAFGTLRKLEGGEEIRMDTAYVINSMNHPNEHVAKGYMPVMMSFKEVLTEQQKEQVAAYLQSQGKPVPTPTPVSLPPAVEVPEAVTPAPEAEATPEDEPAVPVTQPSTPEPTPVPTAVPTVPEPVPSVPEPSTPAEPEGPAGTIFV